MATESLLDPRGWTAQTVDRREWWYHAVSDELLDHLRTAIRSFSADRPITELRLSEQERKEWEGEVAPGLHDLEAGRGFVIFDRLPFMYSS